MQTLILTRYRYSRFDVWDVTDPELGIRSMPELSQRDGVLEFKQIPAGPSEPEFSLSESWGYVLSFISVTL